MRSASVPTSRAVPASTPSGRSVVSRITSTGLPSAGASSCTPPLSVSISVREVEQPREMRVVERLDQRDVVEPGQLGVHHLRARWG